MRFHHSGNQPVVTMTFPERLASELLMYLSLLREGLRFRDKMTILLYLFAAPARYISKRQGKEYETSSRSDVILKNYNSLFFCGKSFNASRIVCSLYERDIRDQFNLEAGVFVDIGAHIGKYAIAVAKGLGEKGRVIAIEPEPNNFGLLKKNVLMNGLKNILCENVACCDRESETILYVHNTLSTCHSIFPFAESREIKARADRLDSILSRLGVTVVDLMKIDVENAEL
jgi:FkbM family methyltransferase